MISQIILVTEYFLMQLSCRLVCNLLPASLSPPFCYSWCRVLVRSAWRSHTQDWRHNTEVVPSIRNTKIQALDRERIDERPAQHAMKLRGVVYVYIDNHCVRITLL